MFGFIGKALSALVLDKKARAAVDKRGGGKQRDKAIASAQANLKDVLTPERAELIRQAMAVRKAKQTILSDLSDEERQRLVAVAMKKLLNEGKSNG